MPPKGWRKHADGTSVPKDVELVSIDEILFPKSTIQKLAKNITAEQGNMILSKDSLLALQRAATVFVSHMMFHGRQVAKDGDRKNVISQDILAALERADLSGFLPVVKQKVAAYEQEAELKKQRRAEAKDVPEAGEDKGNKKLKTSELNAVKTGETEEDDHTISADEGDEKEDEEDDEEMVEEDPRSKNPIALLGTEEQELGGAEPDEENASEDADDADDAENDAENEQ